MKPLHDEYEMRQALVLLYNIPKARLVKLINCINIDCLDDNLLVPLHLHIKSLSSPIEFIIEVIQNNNDFVMVHGGAVKKYNLMLFFPNSEIKILDKKVTKKSDKGFNLAMVKILEEYFNILLDALRMKRNQSIDNYEIHLGSPAE